MFSFVLLQTIVSTIVAVAFYFGKGQQKKGRQTGKI
jgi:hypothetical protein